MGNSAKMDKQNSRMTYRRNVFCRFFYILVMLHKILYSHFTDWNNAASMSLSNHFPDETFIVD